MNHQGLNSVIREMCNEIVESGYKKNAICSVTMGNAYGAQFSKFLEGTDLGISPLNRFAEGLKYELLIVPVKPEDEETKEQVKEICDKFVKDSKEKIINALENRTIIPRRTKNPETEKTIEHTIDNLLKDIE